MSKSSSPSSSPMTVVTAPAGGVRTTRIRTESMVQRLSKKPVSEAFELWDRGYLLGAMRLFQFKVETSPPFQVAPCLEALATLLQQIGEDTDAAETFRVAQEKYDVIQQPWNAKLMAAHVTELAPSGGGVDAALEQVDKIVTEIRADTNGAALDERTKMQLARAYYYRAQLRLLASCDGVESDCQEAIRLGWDRVHLAHYLLGVAYTTQEGKQLEAIAAFEAALDKMPTHVPSLAELILMHRQRGEHEKVLTCVATAAKVHPTCSLVRDHAFALSELGRNEEALDVLDAAVRDPPHEETEAFAGFGESAAVLHRAKAAIYGDMNEYDKALRELDRGLEHVPGDEEARAMRQDVSMLAAREYLKVHNVPEFLDSLVGHVLKDRPENPIQAMVDAIEGNLV
eukprot:PhM_4_TR6781/c0_g1_i1/m.96196